MKAKKEPKPKSPQVKTKNDPKVAAVARELRDRWMEELNAGSAKAVGAGKYDVVKAIAGPEASRRNLLDAA